MKKTKQKEEPLRQDVVVDHQTLYLSDVFANKTTGDLIEFFEGLNRKYSEIWATGGKIVFGTDTDCGGFETVVYTVFRKENDQEFHKRLDRERKTAKEFEAAKKKVERQRAQDERKLYERLHKKYGKGTK